MGTKSGARRSRSGPGGKRLLFEINTRVWLEEIAAAHGGSLTLGEVPDSEIDRIAMAGFEMVWLMGVWKVGREAVEIARKHPDLAAEYARALPDFSPDDVIGSPYSVADYTVDERLGGPGALGRLRERLRQRGVGLILDFVSNHTGVDHRWVVERPDLYVQGTWEDLRDDPGNHFEARTVVGPKIIAHGRDPYFPGWTDTAQINFASRTARQAFRETLLDIAGQCDGVRCDMAMLVLEEVFERVWGPRARRTTGRDSASGETWSEAIDAVRREHPGFLFMAEAYWGLEGRLQSLGFDFTYDKELYDGLLHLDAPRVRAQLAAQHVDPKRTLRFIENHDERRAAAAFAPDHQKAATTLSAAAPGIFLIHEGQLEGRRVKLPVQLGRRPEEPPDPSIREFHERLLEALEAPVFRDGNWRLLDLRPAWDENPSWNGFVVEEWTNAEGDTRWAAVNLSPHRGQCYVEVLHPLWESKSVELIDLLGDARYVREGRGLLRRGLYLDMPGLGHHLFEARPL